MATVDVIILVTVFLFAVVGVLQGLIKVVLSLAIWLAAFFFAFSYDTIFADLYVSKDLDNQIRMIIAFCSIFLLVLIAGGCVQWVLSKLVRSTGLSGTDRLLGFLFGGLGGAILVILILFFARPHVEEELWFLESKLGPELHVFEEDVINFLPFVKGIITESDNQEAQ